MGILVSAVGALSTFYLPPRKSSTAESRKVQTHRLIAKMPTLGRSPIGTRSACPTLSRQRPQLHRQLTQHDVKKTELKYKPNPVLEAGARRALHFCTPITSRTAAPTRCAASALAGRPFSAVAAATAALYGRCTAAPTNKHQDATRDRDVKNVPGYIKRVKAGEIRLQRVWSPHLQTTIRAPR